MQIYCASFSTVVWRCFRSKSSDRKQHTKYFSGALFGHVLLPFYHRELQLPMVKSQVPTCPTCFSLPAPVLSEMHAVRSLPWEAWRHEDEGYCLGLECQGREQTLHCPATGWNLQQKNPKLSGYALCSEFHRDTHTGLHKRILAHETLITILRGLAREHTGMSAP